MLKSEGAAKYILDESVMQVPTEGDKVKEIDEKDLHLNEMLEKTKERVKNLFNLDKVKENTDEKKSVG